MLEKTSSHLFSNTKGCKDIQGAALLHNQRGGGLGTKSHAVDRFNHSSASSYGYDEKGAAVAHELRGSYAAMTKNFDKNHCGGYKMRRKKSPRTKGRRKKSPRTKGRRTKGRRKKVRRTKGRRTKGRRKKGRRKRRKHNKRLTRYKKSHSNKRRRRTKRAQKGGASVSYSTVNKGLLGNDARILGTNSMMLNEKTCGDNYNHFTGGEIKSLY